MTNLEILKVIEKAGINLHIYRTIVANLYAAGELYELWIAMNVHNEENEFIRDQLVERIGWLCWNINMHTDVIEKLYPDGCFFDTIYNKKVRDGFIAKYKETHGINRETSKES